MARCLWLEPPRAARPRAVERPKHLILVSIDTLRPDFLACYGYPRESSPAIDRLAREGTLFEGVTSASPRTLPAHVSLLTGLTVRRHGVIDHDRGLDLSLSRHRIGSTSTTSSSSPWPSPFQHHP